MKMNIVFIAAPASYRNNNGHCFNQCESKVCYSLSNHIVLMGHRLTDDFLCLVTPKALMIYNQLCLRHHDTGHLSLLKLESLQSKV